MKKAGKGRLSWVPKKGLAAHCATQNVPRQSLESDHFALNDYVDFNGDIGVQHDGDRIFTDCLQGAVRQTYLGLNDGVEAIFSQARCDVHRGDGTEQTAVHTSLFDQGQGVIGKLSTHGLRSSQLLGLNFFKFSAALLELFDSGFGGTTRHLLRNQIVTGKTVAYAHDIAKVAQIG